MDGEKADMVFTDPPYGMRLDTNFQRLDRPCGNSYRAVQGDDLDYDPQQLLSIFKNSREFFIWGVDYFHNRIPNGGSFIVWDKRNDELESAIGNDFELCWSREHHKRLVFRKLWSGFTARERSEIRVHPTQKPIALAEWFFERWGKPADIVIDLFLGSGSTLIACEKTGRRCFGMEIDPHYCDVIVERYKKFCGKEVIKC
jgi:DNA modification methylase